MTGRRQSPTYRVLVSLRRVSHVSRATCCGQARKAAGHPISTRSLAIYSLILEFNTHNFRKHRRSWCALSSTTDKPGGTTTVPWLSSPPRARRLSSFRHPMEYLSSMLYAPSVFRSLVHLPSILPSIVRCPTIRISCTIITTTSPRTLARFTRSKRVSSLSLRTRSVPSTFNRQLN